MPVASYIAVDGKIKLDLMTYNAHNHTLLIEEIAILASAVEVHSI